MRYARCSARQGARLREMWGLRFSSRSGAGVKRVIRAISFLPTGRSTALPYSDAPYSTDHRPLLHGSWRCLSRRVDTNVPIFLSSLSMLLHKHSAPFRLRFCPSILSVRLQAAGTASPRSCLKYHNLHRCVPDEGNPNTTAQPPKDEA